MSVVPLRRGGWWHDYVCPTHGVELDPATAQVYPCRYGCELTGEPYAAAWLVFQHQGAAREARRRAHHFRHTGSPEDRHAATQILQAYASLYRDVSQAGWNASSEGWMLRGKLFAQALTEAQWAVQIADAVLAMHLGDVAGDPLDRPVVEMLLGLLETITDARAVLVEQRHDERNNYTAWLNAAGRLLSLALQACGEPADRAALDGADLHPRPDRRRRGRMGVGRIHLLPPVRPACLPAGAARRRSCRGARRRRRTDRGDGAGAGRAGGTRRATPGAA